MNDKVRKPTRIRVVGDPPPVIKRVPTKYEQEADPDTRVSVRMVIGAIVTGIVMWGLLVLALITLGEAS